jgi:hypothetical protein
MKAVLQYRASPGLRQQISALNFPTAIVDEADKDTFRREMADADILLQVLEPVTAAVIDAASHLRLIQEIGIGVNTIDLDAASRRGIAVCNLPGTNTKAVAEMTLLHRPVANQGCGLPGLVFRRAGGGPRFRSQSGFQSSTPYLIPRFETPGFPPLLGAISCGGGPISRRWQSRSKICGPEGEVA